MADLDHAIQLLTTRLIDRALGTYSEHHNLFLGQASNAENPAETLTLIAQADAAAAQQDAAILQALLARREHAMNERN